MDELIQDLRNQIARGRLLVVVGSGVTVGATQNAEAASWSGLLKLGAARCRALHHLDDDWQKRVLGEIESGDLDDTLSAAEKVSSKLGAPRGGAFSLWLRETVGALEPRDSSVLEALRNLRAPLATTNYDGLLERVTELPAVTWREQAKVFRFLHGENPAVLHLHGHWEQPESVVLGIRAYEETLQNAHAQAVIRSLSMTHSLLFVGCGDGLSDPNFRPFLTWLSSVNAGNEAQHYRLALDQDVAALQAQHPPEQRILVLGYGASHDKLPAFLGGLAPPLTNAAPKPLGAPEPGVVVSRTIIPRGLRSFEAQDHAWYLRLVPGPRDENGLPATIRFWKDRLERTDPDETFRVGLLYGPSGCGKSSLVKAGLIPALAEFVLPLHVEASPQDTEATLLGKLRKALPRLAADMSLSAALAVLRDQPAVAGGRKIVLFLDQFEQWLQAHPTDDGSELTEALRHCDGGALQAVLLVRDEFFRSVHRFLETMDVRISEGRNFARADLFDLAHARAVLIEYGRAYERLPAPPESPTPHQEQFLTHVLDSLKTDDGRVVCVHLALLAELLKARPWTPEALRELGGASGVGLHFFRETFDRRSANPAHQVRRAQAMAVLDALLPLPGANIRGRSRSRTALAEAAGLVPNAASFAELLRMLEDELKLITPTEAEEGGSPSEPRYQLTHDYLVPSLRAWLSEARRETARGRAQLCLEERTAQWTTTRGFRFLPGPLEFLRILCFAPRGRRPANQQALVRAASWFWATALAVTVLLAVAGFGLWDRSQDAHAKARMEVFLQAPAEAVPIAADNLQPFRRRTTRHLRTAYESAEDHSPARLRAAIGLAVVGHAPVPFLLDSARWASPAEWRNVTRALAEEQERLLAEVPARLNSATSPESRARLAILALRHGDATPARQLVAHGPDPSDRTAFIHAYREAWGDHGGLVELLRARGADTAAQADFRSALCAALALVDWDGVSSNNQAALRQTMQWLYTDAPDGGTHGASAGALIRWGQQVPPLQPLTNTPPVDRDWFVNRLGITMIRIPEGKYRRGQEGGYEDETPHEVTLTRPTFIADREITVAQFRQFVENTRTNTGIPKLELPDDWDGEHTGVSPTPDCPVQTVNWYDAVKFCNWLSRLEGRAPCYHARSATEWELLPSGDGYRLPTEAEWEYACRTGSQTRFTFGDNEVYAGDYASFISNSEERAWPAGKRLPNRWGLFDLHGNLWEWCHDWYDQYPQEPVPPNPAGPNDGPGRVLRGGSWHYGAALLRSAFRYNGTPDHRGNFIGFRCVWVGGGSP